MAVGQLPPGESAELAVLQKAARNLNSAEQRFARQVALSASILGKRTRTRTRAFEISPDNAYNYETLHIIIIKPF